MGSTVDEIAVKLGLQTADLKAALRDADASIKQMGEKTETTAGGVFGKLEHHLLGTRALGSALSTAFGLHITEIADNVARFITGMSKEEEEAYKEIGTLSTQAADLAIKNMRSRLSEEEKLTLLIGDRERLQKQIDAVRGTSAVALAEKLKLQIEQEKVITEIQQIEDKQQKELAKSYEEGWKIQHKADEERITKEREFVDAQMKTLKPAEELVARRKDLVFYQALLNSGVADQELTERATAIVAKDRVEIVKLEAKIADDAAKKAEDERKKKEDFNKRAALDTKDLLEMELLKRKQLNTAEQAKYDLLVLQTKEKRIQIEIDDLLEKRAREGLTPAEKKRLEVLLGQYDAVEAQVGAQKKVLEEAIARGTAEGRNTSELQHQLDILNQQKAAYVAIEHNGTGDLTTFTDRQLSEYIANSQKIIDANKRTVEQLGFDDPATGQAKLSIQRATDEQNTRRSFRNAVSQVGVDQALLRYSAFDETRLKSYIDLNNTATDQANATNAILGTLAAIFPGKAVSKNTGL